MHPGRQYQLRRQKLSGNAVLEELDSLSWADIRTSCLLDSGISGGLAGAILNTWKRRGSSSSTIVYFSHHAL